MITLRVHDKWLVAEINEALSDPKLTNSIGNGGLLQL